MDASIIPSGDYCYTYDGKLDDGRQGYKIIPCPFWRHRCQIDNEKFDEYNSGYCLFLGKGDIELNNEHKYTLTYPENHPDVGVSKTADEWGFKFSLLWDRVKMCYENIDDNEEIIQNEI